MKRNRQWMPKVASVLLALACNHVAIGQEAKPKPATAHLDELLGKLANTDKTAWQARKSAMTSAAKLARTKANALKAESKTKSKAAAKEIALAKALGTEIKRLGELRAVLAKLTFVDPAGNGKSKGSDQGKLETLLAGLRMLPTTAWDQRIKTMRNKAAAHDKAAATLQKSSKERVAGAAAQDAAAKAIDLELDKLEKLQKLVGTIKLPVVTMTKSAPKAAPKTKPAKAVAKKAPASQPAPKPAAKKPAAKKPAAKKPAAKKPSAKKSARTPKSTPLAANASMAQSPSAKENAVAVEADKSLLTYQDHAYPIFDQYCITCHDPSEASGGLDLSTYATARQGGSSGRTLNPGNPDASRLYLLVSHKEKPTMPPDEDRIDQALIGTIRKWIQQGAPNDLAHAKKLAAQRAAEQQKAMQAAAKRGADKPVAVVVMPDDIQGVSKAYPERVGSMRTVAASPNAPLLAVPGFGQVLLLHQDKLRELGILDFPFGQVEALSFSADGSVLIAAGGTPGKLGGAALFDVRSGRELGQFGEQRDVVLSAATSPNGDLIAIGDTRRRVEIIRVSDGRTLWQERHDGWVTAVMFSPNGELLASADRTGAIVIREATNGREVHTMKGADGLVADLAFSPDSTMLATSGADRSVSLYRMKDGRRLFRQQQHQDQVLCLTWRTPTRLVSSGADGRIMQWKTNGSRDPELPRVGEWVYGLAANSDGSRVFTADWQGRLTTIDTKTRKVIAQLLPLAVRQ